MSMSDDLLRAVGKALEQANPATKANVINKLESEIIVNRSWGGYFNLRVTADVDSLSSAEVTHLKFTPLKDQGLLVVEVANPDEEGAVEFKRSESLRTGTVQMHAALADFDLSFADDRNLVFPIEVASVPVSDGQRKVMIMRVKRRSTKKSIPRPRKNSGGSGGTAGTTATSARNRRTAAPDTAAANTGTAAPNTGTAANAEAQSAPVAASEQTDLKQK